MPLGFALDTQLVKLGLRSRVGAVPDYQGEPLFFQKVSRHIPKDFAQRPNGFALCRLKVRKLSPFVVRDAHPVSRMEVIPWH
ncbi:MAG: hypothetical protein JWO33_2527 [Caulobacteraceae bacterium]|nr:hypothetical protein [Caulobacteraceae bacterium]